MPDVSLNGISFEIKGQADNAVSAIDRLTEKLESLTNALSRAGNSSGKSKTFEALSEDIKELVRDATKLDVLKAKLESLGKSMEGALGKGDFFGAMKFRGQILDTESAIDRLKEKMTPVTTEPLSLDTQNLISSASHIDVLEAKLESLKSSLQNAFNAGNADKAYGIRDQIIRVEEALERAKAAAEKTAPALEEVGKSAKSASKPLGNFISSLKRIAFYRFIRGIIKAITQAFKEGLQNAYQFSKSIDGGLAQALDSVATKSLTMKNQLGAAFGGLLQTLTPVILELISLITKLASAISALFGMFGQGGYLQAKDVWTEWGEAAEGAGGAAKEALKYLAPFDELNVLPDQKSGGGGGSNPDYGSMFDWVEFEEGSFGDKVSDFISDNLESIEALLHTFEFALGVILVLSGANIPLGLGLMAYGGYKLWQDISENWDAISEQLRGKMGEIAGLAGGAEMAIGLILALSGANIPLGIGLIAIGAVTLGTAVAVNWDGMSQKTADTLATITGVISGALLAIGFLLVMSVNPATIALGIGLLAAGAVGLASSVALNWNSTSDKIGAVLQTITAVVSGATLAVGALLTFSGVATGLGIALMAAGAAGIVAAATVNWDNITDKLRGPIGNVVGLISGASLMLGVLLLVAGNIPLGLGLLVAGAGGLATSITANWDSLVEIGKKAVEKVKQGWDSVTNAFEVAVQLVKDGWTTVKDWIKNGGMGDALNKAVGLVRNGWSTVKSWIKNSWMGDALNKAVGLVRNGWSNVKNWITGSWMGDTLNKAVGLARDGWTSVKTWISDSWMGDALNKGIGLIRNGWTNIRAWIKGSFMGDALSKGIGLAASGWTTVRAWISNYMGNALNKGIGLAASGWTTVRAWVSNYMGNALNKGIGLVASGWTTVKAWVSEYLGGTVSIGVQLVQSGWQTVKSWLNNLLGGSLNLTVTSNAAGGVFKNGEWSAIPQYASGGSVHGSLFLAGEAGAELVGHIGGRTEVLNESQLAATMFTAVRSAMASSAFRIVATDPGYSETPQDEEDIMYRAFSRALADSDLGGDVNLDGNALYRAMVTRNRQNTRLTGVNAMA